MAAAIGGTAAALSLSGFDQALAKVPALAFFMPVVAGMGGNVGMQSSTIVVRGLAVGFVEAHRVQRIVIREVSLGAVLGLIYGLLIGSSSYLMGGDADPTRLGFVVMMGTTGSMTIAAFVGTCTPLVLDRFGVDPAVATGPFVTTSDVIGLLFTSGSRARCSAWAREWSRAGTPAVILATPRWRGDLLVVLLTPHDGKVARGGETRSQEQTTICRRVDRRCGGAGGARAALGRRLWRLDTFTPLTDHAAVGRDLTRFAYVAYLWS